MVGSSGKNDGCYAPIGRDFAAGKNVVNIGEGCEAVSFLSFFFFHRVQKESIISPEKH